MQDWCSDAGSLEADVHLTIILSRFRWQLEGCSSYKLHYCEHNSTIVNSIIVNSTIINSTIVNIVSLVDAEAKAMTLICFSKNSIRNSTHVANIFFGTVHLSTYRIIAAQVNEANRPIWMAFTILLDIGLVALFCILVDPARVRGQLFTSFCDCLNQIPSFVIDLGHFGHA